MAPLDLPKTLRFNRSNALDTKPPNWQRRSLKRPPASNINNTSKAFNLALGAGTIAKSRALPSDNSGLGLVRSIVLKLSFNATLVGVLFSLGVQHSGLTVASTTAGCWS